MITGPLRVGGVEVGVIQAFARHNGEVFGRLGFRDPEVYGMPHLDFDLIARRDELEGSGMSEETGLLHHSALWRFLRARREVSRRSEETVQWYRSLYDGPDSAWTRSR